MREILFRGKVVDDDINPIEWVEGDLIQGNDGSCYTLCRNTFLDCNVDPETVGQYTGKKDKDGNRIFEGDIVELSLWPGSYFLGVVEWSARDCAFHIRLSKNNSTGMRYNLTVRGNIHDNPELMEGKL